MTLSSILQTLREPQLTGGRIVQDATSTSTCIPGELLRRPGLSQLQNPIRIDHILGHKSSLGKFKKIEIVSSIFSDHNTVKRDINYRKKICKKYKHMEAKHTLLNNQEITEEIKEEIKKYLETNDNENTTTQNLWDAAKPSLLRGKFIAIQSYLKKQQTSQIKIGRASCRERV